MARIYSFLPRPASAVRREKAPAGPATIIIFPGIRYERVNSGGPGGGDTGTGGSPGRKSAPVRR